MTASFALVVIPNLSAALLAAIKFFAFRDVAQWTLTCAAVEREKLR